MKIEGSGSESGSISQRHGSADPDPQKMSWIRNTGRRHLIFLLEKQGGEFVNLLSLNISIKHRRFTSVGKVGDYNKILLTMPVKNQF
jgi:hypothetical protein